MARPFYAVVLVVRIVAFLVVASCDDDWEGWPYEYTAPKESNKALWDDDGESSAIGSSLVTENTDKEEVAVYSMTEEMVMELEEGGVYDLGDIESEASNTSQTAPNARETTKKDELSTQDTGRIKEDGRQRKKRERNEARLIRRITRAAENNNPYAVLGIQRRKRLRIPSRTITVIPNLWNLETPTLFDISTRYIEEVSEKLINILENSHHVGTAEALEAIKRATHMLLNERVDNESERNKGREPFAIYQWLVLARRWFGPFVVPLGIILLLVV